MLCMTIKNIICILIGLKVMTLRPLKENHKGYFKVGSVQQIKKGMFDPNYIFKVKITNRYFVNINQLTDQDFNKLGYKDIYEYKGERFNINNPSDLRVLYEFEIIDINFNEIKKLMLKYSLNERLLF